MVNALNFPLENQPQEAFLANNQASVFHDEIQKIYEI